MNLDIEAIEMILNNSVSSAQEGRAIAAPPYPGGSIASMATRQTPILDESQRRWAANDVTFWASAQTYDQLPSGLYRCESRPDVGYVVTKSIIDTDSLIALPDSASDEVINEIKTFWTLEGAFRDRGFLWKRGVLLWGPPGSGKTATVQQLIQIVVNEHDGIAVYVDHPGTAAACLQMVRRIEPKRPIIALIEDIDTLVQTYGENMFLALLDGEAQVDNIVFIATTNYPENLDARFSDRPSRFDAVKLIDMPSADARRTYLLAKEPSLADDNQVDEWVKRSQGLSIAHLREMIILCRCYGQTLDAAVARLEDMRQTPKSSDAKPETPKFGFGSRR